MGCLPIPSLQSTISSAELLLQKFLKCQQRLTYREKKKKKQNILTTVFQRFSASEETQPNSVFTSLCSTYFHKAIAKCMYFQHYHIAL